jgi:hypothetical protein
MCVNSALKGFSAMIKQPIDGVYVIHELRDLWEKQFPNIPFVVTARALDAKGESTIVRFVNAVLPPDTETTPIVIEARKKDSASANEARAKLSQLRDQMKDAPVERVKATEKVK